MFEGPIKLIEKANKILLFTHKDAGTDGDALGSVLSLSLALSRLNKKPQAFFNEKVASNFSFLPGLEMLDSYIEDGADLLVFLDFSDLKRGNLPWVVKQEINEVPVLLIDHHPKGDLFRLSTKKIYDPHAASVTEILYFLINELGLVIDKNIATCLLTGIFTDTNNFQNPNTRLATFEIASELLSAGARIEKISKALFFEKPLPVLKLWGRAMQRLYKSKQYDLLITFLTEEDFAEYGVNQEAASGIINFLSLNLNTNARAILLLVEGDGKIKGSIRTHRDDIDVSKLAQALGGGGHKKAAGFEIEGRLRMADGK